MLGEEGRKSSGGFLKGEKVCWGEGYLSMLGREERKEEKQWFSEGRVLGRGVFKSVRVGGRGESEGVVF